MGMEDRAATDDEIHRMSVLLGQSLAEGAFTRRPVCKHVPGDYAAHTYLSTLWLVVNPR
jgi:N-acyl-D-aspartate/D-glutamate deacylase